jgi:hypothetical protein
MAKTKSLKDLKDLRAKLEVEVNEFQKELAEREYSVDIENAANLNAILTQIDKSYEWNIKNAAFLINLYDSLQDQRKINLNAKESEKTTTVLLNSMQLNTLYTVLTNISGVGIESARRFTKLLTNVGAQITNALNEMADNNKSIQQRHVELAELDLEIEKASKPTVEVEPVLKN